MEHVVSKKRSGETSPMPLEGAVITCIASRGRVGRRLGMFGVIEKVSALLKTALP